MNLEDYILKLQIVGINVTVTLVSCIKSEISDWGIAAWFLKPFIERVEKNHYL